MISKSPILSDHTTAFSACKLYAGAAGLQSVRRGPSQLNRKALLLLASIALPLAAQRGAGELRLTVKDPSGLGLEANGSLVGQATQSLRLFTTNPEGHYSIRPLPF